ncbi:MAG TPA: hypothetical protein VK990_09345 [Acidimicrobiia bacterium]|nr:hypothetical protein [Acidimicrobiia bacterium]
MTGASGLLLIGTSVAGAALMGESVLLWPVLLAAWPVVGGVLVARRPDHPVGKLLVLFSVWFSVATSAETYVYLSQSGISLPATDTMAWLAVWAITPVVTIVLFLVVLFPTGRIESKLLRWALRATLVLTVLGLVARAILPVEMTLGDLVFANPWGVDALAPLVPVEEAGFTVIILVLVAAVVDLVVRWRRSSGVERLQMRALALTLSLFVAAIAVTSLLGALGLPDDVLATAETMAWVPGYAAQPVAIGVAVLRYRLYEIDKVVSRTVTYAVVVALLAAVFFAVVTLSTSLLPAESDLAVATSTLAVAALFNPLRRRVHRWVHRHFNRAGYDREEIVARFVGSLRDQIELESVVEGWIDVVDHTMQPALAFVWIRDEH